MQRMKFLAAFVALLAGLTLAWDAPGDEKDKNKDSRGDDTFAQKASIVDLAEINLGNLAARLATSQQVKQFATQMVADHTKSSRMLLSICDRKSLKTATAMDKKHQELFDKLAAKLSGSEFDRDYMKRMVMGHEKAVELYRHEAKEGKDADLKAFADKTLPIVESHFKMAKDINDKMSKGETRR
jgi:putative membrane protein